MGQLLDKCGVAGSGVVRPGAATEAQRAAARALVAKFVASGAVRFRRPAPVVVPVKPTPPPPDLRTVSGRALDEPFSKLTLIRQLGVTNNVAINLLAAWKRRGWTEATGAGYVRCADFGR